MSTGRRSARLRLRDMRRRFERERPSWMAVGESLANALNLFQRDYVKPELWKLWRAFYALLVLYLVLFIYIIVRGG